VEPPDHEQVQKKIDQIYGAQPTEEGVMFVAHAPGAEQVMLAGDFNNWSPDATPMVPAGDDGRFKALLPLSSGRYSYRYVIDGHWSQDPHNDQMEANPFGDVNSVVEVP
jgi:1,4-alpha-glucan branching enzyme